MTPSGYASWGVPAHVSVLYPFVEPAQVDDDLIATLAAVLGAVSAFDCCFARTQWFGKDVLWLDGGSCTSSDSEQPEARPSDPSVTGQRSCYGMTKVMSRQVVLCLRVCPYPVPQTSTVRRLGS